MIEMIVRNEVFGEFESRWQIEKFALRYDYPFYKVTVPGPTLTQLWNAGHIVEYRMLLPKVETYQSWCLDLGPDQWDSHPGMGWYLFTDHSHALQFELTFC
jgi:hypothetical protein